MLFDRYSTPLYEFIYRLLGDYDQAALLLAEVFRRIPSSASGIPQQESVRGWLYSLARQASFTLLRQKGALDALPPSDEPMPSDITGDIWRAARALPAHLRAVLVVEELHGLSARRASTTGSNG